MTKYMIVAFGDSSNLADRTPEWINSMIDAMKRIDAELAEAGELVQEQGLSDPSGAIALRAGATTDLASVRGGPPLAGFWIVDVADEERAREVGRRISEAGDGLVEVRRCQDQPDQDQGW